MTAKGTVVTPDQCVGPGSAGAAMAVFTCPSVSVLQRLATHTAVAALGGHHLEQVGCAFNAASSFCLHVRD